MWSVDRNLNIITYNQVAQNFAADFLKVRVDKGENMPDWVIDKWRSRYQRVLTGEVITLEETVHGIDFRYSLSPIIENANIIGVTVFADNVTERNKQQHALTNANKKISELKVMALRSVMNPHFIFNVLSSIQYFITRNDELNAINSKLMRTVLTRSVADTVTLKEEIDLLKDYVHLESLRFEGKFDFIVDVEGIDSDNIKIPSLLIQPYVENAILHGLCNKDGKGLLRLTVLQEGEFAIFNVEDDGIGRTAANLIQQKNPSERKSMGSQLTEERLTLLNNNDPRPAVVFTDLYKDEVPAGTRVTISIKIKPRLKCSNPLSLTMNSKVEKA
jgi:LytS/YehU family sensor histidine kinase